MRKFLTNALLFYVVGQPNFRLLLYCMILALYMLDIKLSKLSKDDLSLSVEGLCYSVNMQPGKPTTKCTVSSMKAFHGFAREYLVLLKGFSEPASDRYGNLKRVLGTKNGITLKS